MAIEFPTFDIEGALEAGDHRL